MEVVLVHFDSKLNLILATDTSPCAVFTVLLHKFSHGIERPIKFDSQTPSRGQQKYAQIDKEAYAIMYGVKSYVHFCSGTNLHKWSIVNH